MKRNQRRRTRNVPAVAHPGGRPPARSLTSLELQHLRLLLEIRDRARSYVRLYDTKLEDFVLECRDQGLSARGMAAELGVSPATIQTWTKHARERRRQNEKG